MYFRTFKVQCYHQSTNQKINSKNIIDLEELWNPIQINYLSSIWTNLLFQPCHCYGRDSQSCGQWSNHLFDLLTLTKASNFKLELEMINKATKLVLTTPTIAEQWAQSTEKNLLTYLPETNICPTKSSKCPRIAPAITMKHGKCPQIHSTFIHSPMKSTTQRHEIRPSVV